MDLHTYLSQPGAMTATDLARELNVNEGQVRQWRHKHDGRYPGPANCVAIERATAGQVTRQELRPHDWEDIWPELARKRGRAAA